MKWPGRTSILATAGCILLGIFVSAPVIYGVEPQLPSSVDVYWKSTRSLIVPGVSSAVVLDEDVALVQLGKDTIEFAGLSRGDTVVLAYVNGVPISIVVHVIEHPVRIVPPSLQQREAEMAHGIVGSDFQLSNAGGTNTFDTLSNWSWAQQVGDTRFSASTQFEDNTQFGQSVNLRTGSISYRTPHFGFNILDFSQTLTGEMGEDRINNFSQPENVQLRGIGVMLDRGRDEWSFFAGSTVPYYFLSLNATRDVVGFSFHRKLTDRWNLFAGTSFVDSPLTFTDGIHRRSYGVQTVGTSYRFGKKFLVGVQGGISNGGHMARADASYSSFRFSAFGTAVFASQTFPLNQLQSLFSGTSTLKGSLSYKTSARLTQGLYYEHTDVTPGLIYQFSGSSDYLNPNMGFILGRGETMNFGYTYSRNQGGFTAAASTGNRYDASLSSLLSAHLANTAQVTIGSIQDPLQINSEDQLTVRDSISIPIKGQTLLLGFEHDSEQPSLIAKLNQELSVLSPVLQSEFLANPVAFVDSTNFPPEVKALLAAEQPVGTTISAGTALSIGSKLRLSPNVSITHASNGTQSDSWTQSFGYSFVYQFRPTLQFHSSLNNIFLLENGQQNPVRTTVMMFGFQKSFSAAPGGLPFAHHSRIIEGRVFRDMNINGAYNVGEPGMAGIEIRLEDGQVATTDSEGRYKFSSVSADQHQVSIDLAQFRHPVRMTTRGEVEADLIQDRIVVANFGVLDFARVMGYVYNDLHFDNRRQPDSKGMQGITLLLADGKNVRKIETGGSGDFEMDDIAPGDYMLSVDGTSLPANFDVAADAVPVHVSPVSTVVEEVPVRALRSISGRVLLRVQRDPEQKVQASQVRQKTSSGGQGTAEGFSFLPLADVQIKANQTVVKTDQDGNFLIRNLPAGKVAVSLVAAKPIPEGMKLPSGEVNLPADPIQVQGATIVISNPELVPYLTTQPVPNGPGVAPGKSAPILQGKALSPVPSNLASKTSMSSEQSGRSIAASTLPAAAPANAIGSVANSSPASTAARAISEPASTAPTGQLAQLSTVAPSAPVRAQMASAGGLTRADCSSLTSLGETARCYKQLRGR